MITALQIIQQATGEMGLVVPNSVVGTNTADNVQMLALLNSVGYELVSRFPWNRLIKEHKFFTEYFIAANVYTVKGSPILTTSEGIQAGLSVPDNDCLMIESVPQEIEVESAVDYTFLDLSTDYAIVGSGINKNTEVLTVNSSTQLTMNEPAIETGYATLYFCKIKYAFPSDYLKAIPKTHWDKSKHWEMMGPLTPQQWEWVKSGFVASGPRIRYRHAGGKVVLWPPLTNAELLGYEYISSSWVSGDDGSGKASITADTDVPIYPERLLVLGLKIKYFDIKGFDSTQFRRDYEMAINEYKAADGGAATLSFAPQPSNLLMSWMNIPDSGYGGVQ